MIKTEKILHMKSCRGRKVRVVREHYLRPQVPCYSALCQADCANDGKVLPKDLTHYVVPDVQVVLDYLEILEFRELQGIIFTQTACQAVQHKGRRLYNRLQNLLKDLQHDCVLFVNEFQEYSYCPREKRESQEKWHTRCVYSAAVWYHDHLAGAMDIVMITENQDAVRQYGSLRSGVYVISMQDFLQDFWPELQAAHELYSSISQARREREWEGSHREYIEHLPADVMEAGIKSGRYLKGTLNINKHHNEAFLMPEGLSNKNTDLSCGVLVCDTKHRNRAVHGDLVVVELFPKSEWKGKVTALAVGQVEDNNGVENKSRPMPTGWVVGILQRNWRDYVVTFPSRDGTQSQSRSFQHILAVPWDRRIPKIRISTQQADALQNHRVVVRIDSWESTSLYPNGHSVRVLGHAGELETEIQTILLENGINVPPFSDAQLKEMPVNSPEKPWKTDPAQVAERRDLRETHLVFSIDPQGCEDVDDTLSVRSLAGGKQLELGVHIADVTHFVKESSLTDLEARRRATTYYLADRRYDMLPAVLSADLCSLLGGVDRYAMSVMWELDAHTFAVNKVWYGRTLIRSSYQLHYELAQALLNGEETEVPELAKLDSEEKDAKIAELIQALNMLTCVARHLRAQRDKGGALELEGVEIMTLNAATNNQAATAFSFFMRSTQLHGLPSRIERLWRDVWVAVTCKYHDVLHSVEEDGLLDISDVVHLFGVHYIFVPRLQADLDTFIRGWDNHTLRTEGGLTPEHLWCMGHLQDLDKGERLEVRAQLNEERNITALVPRQPLEVHETVAECMIYANHWVARKIQDVFPHQALLRRHPPPRQEFFNQLVETATARGFTIDTRTNKALANSLDKAVDPHDPLVNKLLRMMATTAMSQALYFSTGLQSQDQFYHYGLALDRYTHFTSPIRRYADIVVHRLLTAAINTECAASSAKATASNKELEELALHINSKNQAAQRAQKMSTLLFQCLYFKEREPLTDECCVADAVIYSIRNDGVLVFIPEYGVKAPVYLKNREGLVVSAGQDGSCEWKSGSIQKFTDYILTTSICGTSSFRLFDHITVRISVHSTPYHGDSLSLEVISKKSHHRAEQQQPHSRGYSRLIQEVVRLAEEAIQHAQEKSAQQSKLSKEEKDFSQSTTPNLYSLLEEVRELALMDLDMAHRKC